MQKRDETEILIPFIGAFSSGKSSLVNALLGEQLLSTDITPETALPIELRFGTSRKFTAYWPDGRQEPMAEQTLLDANFNELATQDGWINAELSTLEPWPNLVLVDLPGWSSSQSAHERHIDDYLLRLARTHLDTNVLFVVVIGADEGTLRENVRERLQAINMGGASYLLVLSKADKRSPEDQQQILTHLQEAVTAAIGKPAQKVLTTSARKSQIDSLRDTLTEVQKTLKNKEPLPDTAELAKEIERYIGRIDSALEDDLSDPVRYIAEETWERFDDKIIDNYVSYVLPDSNSRTRKFLAAALDDEAFEKFFRSNLRFAFPEQNENLVSELKKLNIHLEKSSVIKEHGELLAQRSKKHINLAFEKAKPGLFASADPEAFSERVRSRLRGMKSEITREIMHCAREGLRSYGRHEIEEWKRVQQLING